MRLPGGAIRFPPKMPEAPGPDDRLGLRLVTSWSKVEGGYRGAIVTSGTGRWDWECPHDPHSTKQSALECARSEVRARRQRLSER
jgi:hypothetical protein